MVAVNAVIRVDIDASAANAGLASMAAQMGKFNKGMIQGSAAMSAAQVAAANRAAGALNRTGQWVASTGSMMTATGRMAQQFDKGTAKSFKSFRENMAMNNRSLTANSGINQLAAARVRALQTQYTALGREVDGVQRVMKAQPTGMVAAQGWGSAAEFANQRAILFRRNLTMGANSMINWGKNTQWAGRQMMVGMGIPMGLAAVGAVRAFKDIEAASISFKRVYGDATTSAGEKAQMLGKIQSGVAQEMTKYGIATADTLQVAAKAAATGQKGDDLVAATRETMRLATLGQLDYDQALQSTIATQTAFGVSSQEMTRVTDFLNAAENQTILSMDDMTKAIPRVAPVIRGLGGDVEDLGVLMTALRAGGVTAEQGANALKSGLASLINPTSSATEAMESLGIPLDKIVKSNKGDLIGTVQDFGKALNKLPKFEQQQALESLFGKYQYARMGALFRNINSKQAQETAKLSKASSANLAKMSENEMAQIADSNLTKFQGAIERLKAAAAPLGGQILGFLAPLVDGFAKITDFFATNDVAGKVLMFGAAFAGLAGVGTMLTGVFANFFGTMIKGAQGMHRLGRFMIGKPLPKYNSIEDLEAAAAQRQLSSAAEMATASLYGEKGAVTQLAAALNAMNAELSQTVGLQAAIAGGGRPLGGAVAATGTGPKASPSGGAAAPIPRAVVPAALQSGRTASVLTSGQRAHMGRPTNLAQIQAWYANKANAEGYGGKTGEAAKKLFDAHAAQVATGNVHSGVVARHSYDINRQQELDAGRGRINQADVLGDIRTRGGATFADIVAQTNGRKFTAEHFASMDRAAEAYFGNVARLGPEFTNDDLERAYRGAVEKELVGEGKVMSQQQWDNMQKAQTIDTGTSRIVLPKDLRADSGTTWKTAIDQSKQRDLVDHIAANTHSLDQDGKATVAHSAATVASTEAVKEHTQQTQKGATAASSEAKAVDARVKAAEAEEKKRAAVLKRTNLTEAGRAKAEAAHAVATQDLAKARAEQAAAIPTRGISSPIDLKGDPWGPRGQMSPEAQAAARRLGWTPPSPSQRVSFGGAGKGQSDYNGFMSQKNQQALAGNLMGSKRGIAGGILGSLFNRGTWNAMRAGGAFGGGTRGMTPQERGEYKASQQNRVSGKLMGLGMAADAVTMGLAMTGHDIPVWTHMLGMGMMTLGMFPGAVTPLISLLSNPVTGALAALAASAGAVALAYNFAEDQARQSGIAMGNQATLGAEGLKAMEGAYQSQSLYSKVMDRRAAQEADVTTETYQKAKQIAESEYGQGVADQFAQAVKTGGQSFAESGMANQLAQGVLQKVISAGDAKALTETLIGGTAGESVRTQLTSMIGKNGGLVSSDPYAFASKQLAASTGLSEAALARSNQLSQTGVTWGKNALSSVTDTPIESPFAKATDGTWAEGWGNMVQSVRDTASSLPGPLGTVGKVLSGTSNAWEQFVATSVGQNKAIAQSEGYAASMWSNTLASGYQNRIAAEERLRIAQNVRADAQKKMTSLENQGLKSSKEYAQAADQYAAASKTIKASKESQQGFDNQMASAVRGSIDGIAGVSNPESQRQILDTGWDALAKRYEGNAAQSEMLLRDKMAAQMGIAQLAEQDRARAEAATQAAMSTGMMPGDLTKYSAMAGRGGAEFQGGKEFTQLANLMTKGGATGGDVMAAMGSIGNIAGGKQGLVQGLFGVQSPQEFKQYQDGLNNLTKLGPAAQKALKPFLPGASSQETGGWVKDLKEGNKQLSEVEAGAAAAYAKRTGQKPLEPQKAPLPSRGAGKDAGSGVGAAIKPNTAGAAAAGKAEGAARANAANSVITQKAQQTKAQQVSMAQQTGTQQGKAQGLAMGAGIGAALGKTKSQSSKVLSSMTKAGKQGQIKLRVDDAGATGKINKVKSAMSKLKTGKGGDIKLKATDNASPKIQKVNNKAKQLKSLNAQVKMKAQDNASPKIQKVKSKANSLKSAKATVMMKATDNASPKMAEVKAKAVALKSSDVNVPIKATDNASPTINVVKTGLTAVGAMHPNPPISASDGASGTISSVSSALSSLDGQSATVHINVEKNGAVGGSVADYLAKGGHPISRGVFTGRRVSGPGGPEEDKVPAWLSPGEFVMRQRAVRKYGSSFMHKINSGQLNVGEDGALHLKKGTPGKDDDSKKKKGGKDKSGDGGDGGGDKDTGWKDLTKEIKKMSKVFHIFNKNVGKGKPYPQIGKPGKKKDVSAEMMATLLGTGSPNAMKNFFGKRKKALGVQKKLNQQIKVETLQAYYEQTASDEKSLEAARYKEKLLKKARGVNQQAILKLTDEEVLGMKQMKIGVKQGKKYAAQSGDRKIALEKKQAKFDLRSSFFDRTDSLAKEMDYNNRFGNAKLAAAKIGPEALANMSQEDFDIAMSLSSTELKTFAKQLNAATLAAKRAENMALSQSEKNTKVVDALGQYEQTFIDAAQNRADRNIVKAKGKTRGQIEADLALEQVNVDIMAAQQTKEQQAIDDINKSYDEQQQLLDKISQSQQIISSLQKGRLNVASALSSGDIAAAAAAAQEQRAAEAQANLDMMKQALQDDQDAKIKKHQDIIDDNQKKMDVISNRITDMQNDIALIDATAAKAGADLAAPYEEAAIKVQEQAGYWAEIRQSIYDSLEGIDKIGNLDVGLLFRREAKVKQPTGGGGGGDQGTPYDDPWKNSTKKSKSRYMDAAEADEKYRDQVSNARRRISGLSPKKQKAAEKKLNKINNSKLSDKGDNVDSRLLKAAMAGNEKKSERLSEKAQKIDNKLENRLYNAGLLVPKKDKDLVKPKVYDNKPNNKNNDNDNKKGKDNDKNKKPKKKAFGGFVGGMGNTDKVPALLTPGEFVMTKGAAGRFGKALEKVNSPSFKFADKAGMLSGGGAGAEGNVYNVTINANGVADAEEIATITLNKIKQLDSMRVREMRTR